MSKVAIYQFKGSAMLTQNCFDRQKARSNQWFFSYVLDNNRDGGNGASVRRNEGHPMMDERPLFLRYCTYGLFVICAILALYTRIALVSPTSTQWYDTTREAYGISQYMAIQRHHQLALRYTQLARRGAANGQVLRGKAAKGLQHSRIDAHNATFMYNKVKENWQEAQQDKEDILEHAGEAKHDHDLYGAYRENATFYEERAKELEAAARSQGHQYWKYRNISLDLFSEAQQDEKLEEAYLANASLDGEAADNITQTEEDREDRLWVCQWSWARQYVCSVFGGYTELGKADELRQDEAKEYQEAMGLQKQLLVAQTDAMIARTKALRAEEEAKHDHLEAIQDKNISLIDKAKASEAHAQEFEELQEELEAMRHRHEHLQSLEYYQGLEVILEIQAKKEGEFAVAEWKTGTEMLHEAQVNEGKASEEEQVVKEEIQKQADLIEKVYNLGSLLRFYSATATAYALLSIVFFVVALITTEHVALGYQVKTIALALSMNVACRWQNFQTSWEGRNILGGNEKRELLRQLSCWCHHGLFFLVVASMLGEPLESIFEYNDLQMRGEITIQFALLAGFLETMLFQGIPSACVLESFTIDYFKNVSIKFISSSCRFAIQMLLLLVLFGQDSSWLFPLIHFLTSTYVFWIMVLVATLLLHFWFIEIPYAMDLMARNSIVMSDVTFVTHSSDVTIEVASLRSNMSSTNTPLVKTRKLCGIEEKGATIATLPADDESESLLTNSRSHTQTESMESLPYSSISLGDSNDSSSAEQFYSPPALRNLYTVSLRSELYSILAHIELLLLAGSMLVICACLPKVVHHYRPSAKK